RPGVVAANAVVGKIAGRDLGLDLRPRVRRDHGVGQRHALVDADALADEGVALHVAHGGEAVDAGDAEPVQHVRHQLLEAHVLHAGDAFCALEIAVGPVAALLPLAGVVDQEFGDFAERAAFLTIVDHEPDAAGLRHLDGDLDAVREIGPAGDDVGAEYVGPVAFVVYATGQRRDAVAELGRIAKAVDGGAADRRQEDLEIGAVHQLGIHAAGLFVQSSSQIVLGQAE